MVIEPVTAEEITSGGFTRKEYILWLYSTPEGRIYIDKALKRASNSIVEEKEVQAARGKLNLLRES